MSENDNSIETNKNPVLFNISEKYKNTESYTYSIENKSTQEGDYSNLFLAIKEYKTSMMPQTAQSASHPGPKESLFSSVDHVEIYFWKDAAEIDTINKSILGAIEPTQFLPGNDAMTKITRIPLGTKVGEGIKEHHPEEMYAVFLDKDRRTIAVGHIIGQEKIDRVANK